MKQTKTRMMLAAVLCAVAAWSLATLAEDGNGDIRLDVILPGELPDEERPIISGVYTNPYTGYIRTRDRRVALTLEQQERNEWLQKLEGKIPYDRWQRAVYTFGQASKRCDRVVAGTVGTVEKADPQPPDVREVVFVEGQQVTLSVDASLYGKNAVKKLAFWIPKRMVMYARGDIEQRVVKSGDRMLVFLTDKLYNVIHLIDPPPRGFPYFDFDKSKAKWDKADVYVLAHIILDDKETEQAAINAAKGYLGFFGDKGKRDRDRYYEFLCSLLQSPVKRIRDDAESDLVLFYTKEKDPPPDLDKLLADKRVRKEVKDYLRYLLRNEKPKE